MAFNPPSSSTCSAGKYWILPLFSTSWFTRMPADHVCPPSPGDAKLRPDRCRQANRPFGGDDINPAIPRARRRCCRSRCGSPPDVRFLGKLPLNATHFERAFPTVQFCPPLLDFGANPVRISATGTYSLRLPNRRKLPSLQWVISAPRPAFAGLLMRSGVSRQRRHHPNVECAPPTACNFTKQHKCVRKRAFGGHRLQSLARSMSSVVMVIWFDQLAPLSVE